MLSFQIPKLAEEVQVSVNEEAADKPKTGEEGAFELPEGDFEDGMLGISVSMSWNDDDNDND